MPKLRAKLIREIGGTFDLVGNLVEKYVIELYLPNIFDIPFNSTIIQCKSKKHAENLLKSLSKNAEIKVVE